MKHLLFIVLILCASAALAQPVFSVGDNVKVIAGITCVNVRPVPAASTPIGCKVPGTAGVIKGGPTMWGSQPYYQVLYSDGILGWSAAIYLQFVAPAPPSVPPPSGTLSVTPITNGKVILSYTTLNDTATTFPNLPRGLSSGTITIPLLADGAFAMTLYGRGGSVTYTASTANGTPLPPPADLKRMLDSAYAAGRASIMVNGVDVRLNDGRVISR